MITTTYTCDRCKKAQPTQTQFWTVRTWARSYDTLPAAWHDAGSKEIQVCRLCLEDLGFNVRTAPGVTPPPPPTVEDLVREIFRLCADEVQP